MVVEGCFRDKLVANWARHKDGHRVKQCLQANNPQWSDVCDMSRPGMQSRKFPPQIPAAWRFGDDLEIWRSFGDQPNPVPTMGREWII
jgi:hypothetical protein